jgi:hypothetical protein
MTGSHLPAKLRPALATSYKSGMAGVDCALYGNFPLARRFRPSR